MPYFLFTVLYLGIQAIINPADYHYSTGHSGTGANIDIKFHRFEWNINPDLPKRISGSVTTYFVTTEKDVSMISFDLNEGSFNNPQLIVKYHGKKINHFFPESGYRDILTIKLPVLLDKGKLDSVTIHYNGVPPPVDGEAEGCQQKDIAGYPLFYTLSESYEDKDWWPCKADMQDKIDSLTFIFTTPVKYTPAANGRLIETIVSGDKKVTVYKHKYPIASYLVGIAVTQYNIFDRGTVTIGNSKVPVVYYISKGRSVSEEDLATMDESKFLLKEFSRLFGDYPFKNEKYGMYEFGWSGAMEHQTFSAMSWKALQQTSTIAHELMHQWFGDKVTFRTWNDLWLAEGFASYSTVLAPELRGKKEEAQARRRSLKMNANGNLKDVACYIPESSIENSNAIWESDYGSSVYQRGAMVVSMLRTLMGDSGFFLACRNYLDDPNLAYKSASTKDLQRHMEKELGGFDLSAFFNSYVYGNGYPIYGSGGKGNPVSWKSKGTGKIIFEIGTPAKSEGSTVAEYSSVIPLRVTGANGEEKMVVLYDQGEKGVSLAGNGIVRNNSRMVETEVGFVPVKVDFDPYNTSLAEGIVVQIGTGFDTKR